ncbi:hypothetical protein [Nocardia sp. IFM 10818]
MLLQGDGQVYNATTGQFEAMTEKVLETATKDAPKFLTGQTVTQGSKLLAPQAQNFALAGLLDGSASLVDRSLLAAEYTTKFGRFGAPIISAPVGIYRDIRSGVDPGEAITSGVVGADVTVAAPAVLGTGFLPGLAAAGIGLGAYYGTNGCTERFLDDAANDIPSPSGTASALSGLKGGDHVLEIRGVDRQVCRLLDRRIDRRWGIRGR